MNRNEANGIIPITPKCYQPRSQFIISACILSFVFTHPRKAERRSVGLEIVENGQSCVQLSKQIEVTFFQIHVRPISSPDAHDTMNISAVDYSIACKD